MPPARSAKRTAKVEVVIKPEKKKPRKKASTASKPSPNSCRQTPKPPTEVPHRPSFIPTEILLNILKYAYPSTLSRCMRVSKTFYEVAGPLLYSNVIIKDQQPMSDVLIGVKKIDKNATRCRPETVNLKKQLLTFVQQLTVATHICKTMGLPLDSSVYKNLFPADLFRKLKTLLVIPYAECCVNEHLCDYSNRCPILNLARPQKVVLHNSRVFLEDPAQWLMCSHTFTIECPTVTLVLDETSCYSVNVDKKFRIGYVRGLKNLRIIVSKTPAWLDKIAQRVTCSPDTADIHMTATGIVAPVVAAFIADSSITITIYLFRDLDSKGAGLEKFGVALDKELSFRRQKARVKWDRRDGPAYAIKTLSNYIDEGLEDEFLWQELRYWRGENLRRSNGSEVEHVEGIDGFISHKIPLCEPSSSA